MDNAKVIERFNAASEWFVKLHDTSDSAGLRDLATSGLSHLLLCREQFVVATGLLRRFSASLNVKMETWLTWSEGRKRAFAAKLREASLVEEPHAKAAASDAAFKIADELRRSTEEQIEESSIVREQVTQIDHSIFGTFVDDICDIGDERRNSRAISKLGGLIISMSPAGPFVTGVQTIQKVLDQKIEGATEADALQLKVELWIQEALSWCILARYISENINCISDDDDQLTVDQIADLVNDDLVRIELGERTR